MDVRILKYNIFSSTHFSSILTNPHFEHFTFKLYYLENCLFGMALFYQNTTDFFISQHNPPLRSIHFYAAISTRFHSIFVVGTKIFLRRVNFKSIKTEKYQKS